MLSQSLRDSSMASKAGPLVWYVSMVSSSGLPFGRVLKPSAPFFSPISSSRAFALAWSYWA